MKEIRTEDLTVKAKKEIERFYSSDRFQTIPVVQKIGRGYEVYFVEEDNWELFKRQQGDNLENYLRVVD